LVKVAVDAMGGDYAPGEIVKGAVEALADCPDLTIYLVGKEDLIRQYLEREKFPKERVEIIHAEDVIYGEDNPGLSIKTKKESSMVKAQLMVRDGAADAILSAGNTGALMAGGTLFLGRIQGVSRPALLTIIPAFENDSLVLLDVGANMDARPEQLVQYALMGQLYAQNVLKRDNPSVGLINVGAEHNKGNEQARKAFELIDHEVHNFNGNIEGNEILNGKVDVAVCDGFVGNVLLKTIEGLSKGLFSSLKEEFTRNWINTIGASLLQNSFRGLQERMDESEYGGAPLIGVNGICIKCHGSSKSKAVKMALSKQIHPLVQNRVNDSIEEVLVETNSCRKEA